MQNCPRCLGSRKIAPMGGIYVDCPVCHAIGKVSDERANELKQPFKGAVIAEVDNANNQVNLDSSIAEIASETPPALGEKLIKAIEPHANGLPLVELTKKRPGRKPGWNKQA